MNCLARFMFYTYLLFFTVGFTIYFTFIYINAGNLDLLGIAVITSTTILSIISFDKIRTEIDEA